MTLNRLPRKTSKLQMYAARVEGCGLYGSREDTMPSTKDKKDKMSETGRGQQEGQNPDDRKNEQQNSRDSEGIKRDKSREQSAGAGRKM
jgi:hypothetical protein